MNMKTFSKKMLSDRIILTGIIVFLSTLMFVGCNSGQTTNETKQTKEKMEITKEPFGKTKDSTEIYLFTLTNDQGMVAKITNYGGILTELFVPDKDGNFEDVVLGFDNLEDYLGDHPHFGGIIGRFGNRIAKGKFSIDGTEYTLAQNNGENHLHGGIEGFDRKVWNTEPVETENGPALKLSYLSEDMEEGYPGNLNLTVTYTLTNDNSLKIDYEAVTDKASPVNFTNHSYFNLTACEQNIHGHEVIIDADRYVIVNESLIPTGDLPVVEGTLMDFTTPMKIGARIDDIPGVPGGYDHCYVVNKEPGELKLIAKVTEPESGRVMEVYSTEPGVQLYTGNFLDGSNTGKNDVVYNKHYGFCLETQHFPDSPNQPDFPSTILEPGEKYTQTTIYKFIAK